MLCNAAGEAEAIYRRADATAKGIGLVSQAVTAHGGSEAASLRVAEQYLSAFGQIAKAGNTLLLPAATNDPANMVAQAMSIYKVVADNHPSTGPRCGSAYSCRHDNRQTSLDAQNSDAAITMLVKNAAGICLRDCC